MSGGYEIDHGAKQDRATYRTTDRTGYEPSILGVQVFPGPVVLMSLHVDIGAIVDNLWIQVYDQNLINPDGTANPLSATARTFLRRSRVYTANDADLTYDWCPCPSDEVEDQDPVTRGNLNNCKREDINVALPIKGFPFTKGVVVAASLHRDHYVAAPTLVLGITARGRYGTITGQRL